MSRKIFVGGLAWATTDDSLRAAFEPFGQVVEAKVIVERDTGRSRGFGFVTFEEESSAAEAMERMNGQTLDGRAIRINPAEETKKKPGGRPQRPFSSGTRSPEVRVQRRDDAGPQGGQVYPSHDFGYGDDGSNQRRENRKKDKRKRDRFDDDDRW